MRILMVCLGNICRSPIAQAVLEAKLRQCGLAHIEVDSAGTSGVHAGEPPDPRAQRAARNRGYDLSRQRSRQLKGEDFQDFSLILAMDNANLQRLRQLCPQDQQFKLKLLLDYRHRLGRQEVPAPYYGNPQHFEDVLDLVEDACGRLAHDLQERGV